MRFNKKQLKQLKRLEVEVIYLFGSQAQGLAHSLSDFDIGVIFKNPEKIKDTLSIYNKLYKIFSEAFPKEKDIDVVFLQFVPLSVQHSALPQGKVIYQDKEENRFKYQEDVLRKYLDFKHYLNIAHQAILARI